MGEKNKKRSEKFKNKKQKSSEDERGDRGSERNKIKASDRDKAGERKPSDGFLFGGLVEITSFH